MANANVKLRHNWDSVDVACAHVRIVCMSVAMWARTNQALSRREKKYLHGTSGQDCGPGGRACGQIAADAVRRRREEREKRREEEKKEEKTCSKSPAPLKLILGSS